MRKELKWTAALVMASAILTGCGQAKAPAAKAPDAGDKGAEVKTEQAAEVGQDAKTAEAAKTSEAAEAAAASEESKAQLRKLDKDVTIYVTVKPGGIIDVRARAIAPYLAEKLGVGVTVKNVAGGGGVICATQFFTEKHGPYDILMGGASTFTSSAVVSDVSYAIDDMVPLGSLDNEQFGLFVCPEKSGLHTMQDVIDYGKGNTIIFGSGGVGNATFTMQDELYKALGLPAETLTHGNAPEGITNCMGGHNVITMAGLETARSYVESGDVVPVLTFSEKEFIGYDGITVPSIVDLPGCEGLSYSGLQFLCVSSKTDAAAVALMQDVLKQCLADEKCQADLAGSGLTEISSIAPDEITKRLKAEHEMFLKIAGQ